MTRETLENRIIEVLHNMSSDEFVSVWNEYASEHYPDDEIYSMDMFDEVFCNEKPLYVIERCFYGYSEWGENREPFNPNDTFFYFNGYGNVVSVDYVEWNEYCDGYTCSIIDENGLVNYIIDDMTSCCNDELADILDEYENDLDEGGEQDEETETRTA